jgi:hypothetical protein
MKLQQPNRLKRNSNSISQISKKYTIETEIEKAAEKMKIK